MNAVSVPFSWRLLSVKELTREFISGGTPSTKDSRLWEGDIPWTTSAPITEDAIILDTAQRFISRSALETSATNLVPKGNLLIGTRVGVGKAVVNLIDIAISQDLTGAVIDHALVDAEFIAYQFKAHGPQLYLEGRKRGTTIKGISRFDLEALELYIPPLPEQRAIAHALQAVQDAIAARRRELALERERKAALMQHLFTYGIEGDSSPCTMTRFGRIPERWTLLPLAECAEVQTGVAKGRRLNGDQAVSVPYLRVANVQDGRLDLSEIKEIELRASEVDRYSLQSGDVLMTEGGDLDKLGRGFIWNDQIPGCVHQNHISQYDRIEKCLCRNTLLTSFRATMAKHTS